MVNVKQVKLGKNTRMSFEKIKEVLDMPNLIEVQKNSYQWFLDEGLREVLRDVATITDHNENLELSFVDYRLDEKPKYSITECKERDTTYAAPLRVTARLLNKETGEIKESEVFMGDFPLMTDSGTFIINGAERVIVSQLVRSPGVYFSREIDKTGKSLFSSTIIPNRGAWIEYETDHNDIMYVRIDKNRKLPMTTFVRAIGLVTNEQIIEMLGESDRLYSTLEKDTAATEEDALLEVYKKLRPGEPFTVDGARTYLYNLLFDPRRYDLSRVGRYKYNKKLALSPRLAGRTLSRPIVHPETGEILAEAGELITKERALEIEKTGVDNAYITLEYEGEQVERKILTNGTVDAADFVSFDPKEVGINERVCYKVLREILDGCDNDDDIKEQFKIRHDELIPNNVTIDDIYASMNYICGLPAGLGTIDDIDHLGNRRIRSVGELLQNQFRIGFARMERVVREKMALQTQESDVIVPQSLINIRPVVAAIREFFGSSPLSQFMDQINPLAELTHKRRLSALGPGGLSRDRAGFEVRDVHYSHYGRMCSIETPEGPNIGLIS
ncbi:MAG: DNA-directed RNA polymerase subunit beta, partial [Acutalibacteraceae bacterium]|nr:DNA-directed RNA polymerase subunit beta [Acutalibacteraceae bacterium]